MHEFMFGMQGDDSWYIKNTACINISRSYDHEITMLPINMLVFSGSINVQIFFLTFSEKIIILTSSNSGWYNVVICDDVINHLLESSLLHFNEASWMFLTFLYEFKEDLDECAVFGGFQRVVGPITRRPAAWHEASVKHLKPINNKFHNSWSCKNVGKSSVFNLNDSIKTRQIDLTRLSWELSRRSHISASLCPPHPPANIKHRNHISWLLAAVKAD